jgi:tetratricopeptide (TPR) repeat protein
MPKKGYVLPLAVLVVGVLVRVLFTLQSRDLPFYYHPVLDSGFFHQWARFKAEVTWADATVPFREPGYAFFVAVLYRIFGQSFTAVRLVQSALGGLTALLIYNIGARLFGRGAGATAGLIYAVLSLAVFFTGELNGVILTVFLVVLSFHLLIAARDGRAYLKTTASGLLLGLAFMLRFTVIAALFAWLIHLLLQDRARLRAAAALVFLGFLVVPVCYNAFLLDADDSAVIPTRAGWQAFLGSSSTGGAAKQPYYVITLGAQAGAARAYAETDLTDGERDAMRFARIEGGENVSRKAAGRYWQNRTFDDLFSSPSAYLGHYFAKFGLLWGPSLPSPNIDSRFMAGYSPYITTALFPFAVLAGLGLVGFVVFTRRRSSAMLLFVIIYSLLASIYLISDADKMLLLPFLIVFCGRVLVEIVRGFTGRSPLKSAVYLVAVVVLSALLWRLPSSPVNAARHMMIMGDIYSNESLFDRAEESFEAAIAESPDFSDARLALAKLLATTGKPDRAIAELSEAIGLDPGNPRLRIEKASLLTYVQQPAEAIAEINTVEQTFPYEPRLHQFKGIALMEMDKPEEAVGELELEIAYVGGDFVTYSALGRAEFQLGKYEEAAAAYETALRSNPYSTPTVMQLADCYTMLDRNENAAEILARVVAVDPGNVRLRFKLGNALYRAGRFNEALKDFKEISKFDPRNTDILLNMGVVYAEMDSLDQAVAVWEKVLEIEPDNKIARENLKSARE